MKLLAMNVLPTLLFVVILSIVAVYCHASSGIRGADFKPTKAQSQEDRRLQQIDLFAKPVVCERSLSIELTTVEPETLVGGKEEFNVTVQIRGLLRDETWKLTKVTMATNGLPAFEALQVSPWGNITFSDPVSMEWLVEIDERDGGNLFALATATAQSDETGKQCVISNTILV